MNEHKNIADFQIKLELKLFLELKLEIKFIGP